MQKKFEANYWLLWTMVCLALVSSIKFITDIHQISRSDPWWHNLDMDFQNILDAFRVNSGGEPFSYDQPGFLMKYLVALFYKATGILGLLKVSSMSQLLSMSDPIAIYPSLIGLLRIQCWLVAAIFVLTTLWMSWSIWRSHNISLLCLILFTNSPGLLIHFLYSRPEILCVYFGCIWCAFALFRLYQAPDYATHRFCLMLCGFVLAESILGKVLGTPYILVAIIGAVCIYASKNTSKDRVWPEADLIVGRHPLYLAIYLIPPLAFGTLGVFYIISAVKILHGLAMGWIYLVAFMILGLSSLLIILGRRFPHAALYRDMCHFINGFMGALLLTVFLTLFVMSPRSAMHYDGEVISYAMNPLGSMGYYAINTNIDTDVLLFLHRDGLMWWMTAVIWILCMISRTHRTGKIVVTLFPLVSMLFIYACSKRGCLPQYLIFSEVPLYLGIICGVSFLVDAWCENGHKAGAGAIVIVLVGAMSMTHNWLFQKRDMRGYYNTSPEVDINYIDNWLYGREGAGAYFWRDYYDRVHQIYGDERQFNDVFDRISDSH